MDANTLNLAANARRRHDGSHHRPGPRGRGEPGADMGDQQAGGGADFSGKNPSPGRPRLPDDEVAALMAAVQVATGGRGRVTEIRVIDNAD
jgi:hypothetical protein